MLLLLISPVSSVTLSGSNTGKCAVDGNCFSSLHYDNNERCTFTVGIDGTLSVDSFHTEQYDDYLTVGGRRYSGSSGPYGVNGGPYGVDVSAGDEITWYSDGGVQKTGFRICVRDRGSSYLLPLIILIVVACLVAACCCFTKAPIRPVNDKASVDPNSEGQLELGHCPDAAQGKLGDLVVRPREKLEGWRDCARLHDGIVFRGRLPFMRRKITFSHFLFDDRCLMS